MRTLTRLPKGAVLIDRSDDEFCLRVELGRIENNTSIVDIQILLKPPRKTRMSGVTNPADLILVDQKIVADEDGRGIAHAHFFMRFWLSYPKTLRLPGETARVLIDILHKKRRP